MVFSPAAFAYRVVLARRSPHPVSYEGLLNEAQKYPLICEEARKLARRHIHELRVALEPDPEIPRFIIKVGVMGYLLGYLIIYS